MNFLCSRCNHTRLEERMENVTLTSEILSVGEGGDVEYGDSSHEDGDMIGYQCMSCGLVLKDTEGNNITDSVELYEYLQGQKT